MDKIEITKTGENLYRVEVSSEGHRTIHEVTLSDEYWHHIVGGNISKKELLEKSFQYLLSKERNIDILTSFSLEKISQYFPDFERDIRDEI